MAISEFETHRFEKIIQQFIETQGPCAEIHDRLKWGHRIDSKSQSIELFEIRPHFMDASRKIQSPIAKAVYVKSSKKWKVYWMRGTGKWAQYEPQPNVKTIDEFLKIIREDAYGCFLG